METAPYTVATFAEMLSGKWLVQGHKDEYIAHLLTDSRLFQPRQGSVFFAIRSRRNDGHKYVQDLLKRGMKNFVLSDAGLAQSLRDVNVILVDDAVAALQRMAAIHRSRFDIPVIGITGSNGKTVVKEWLFQLLQRKQNAIRSPRSYNSQVGVPMSAWLIRPQHEVAILEAGISKPGEMERLEKIIKPVTGIFTNIGEAHQENFESLAQKIEEKIKLFQNAERIIYCRDQPEVHAHLQAPHHLKQAELYSWSKHAAADLKIKVEQGETGTYFKGIFRERERQIFIPFKDSASIENSCHCWLYLLLEGFSDEYIAEGMAALSPIAMRLEQLDGVRGSTLINDVYNSDFSSLEIALDQLMLQRKNKHYTAIISDIMQSGEPPELLYAKMAELIRSKSLDTLIGIGPKMVEFQEKFAGLNGQFYESTEAFLDDFKHSDFGDQNILVKGARSFAFERITDILSEKTHETILEIDLERLRDNLNYVRSLLNPDTGIMVMVKAFAYGSGAYEIARTLEFHGVAYLAVAYADEGITLREAGIQLPILVLNPELSSYDAMIRYRLEPQIYSFLTLERFTKALFARQSDWPYPVHIKLNTGMNRLGFDPHELDELGKRLSGNDAIEVISVFSHMAASESADFDALSRHQIEQFDAGVEKLRIQISAPFRTHLLNSQGIFRFPDQQRDYVRLGLALYGISGNAEFRKHLKPVSKLITTVSQVRTVAAGQGIGYSPKKMLSKETQVAVIPVGYADGLPRALGNGIGHVLIRGKRCPFLGNICMDMAMVDVSGTGCTAGDAVEVFGDHMDLYEMAANLKTIPYEVLTSISQRVKRVYLHQ